MGKEKQYKYVEQGSRLREYAEDKYGTMARLERKIDVRQKSLSQYANGRNGMGVDLLTKLALDGCDINWLLTGVRYQSVPSYYSLVSEKVEQKEIYELKTRLEEITKRLELLEKNRDENNL